MKIMPHAWTLSRGEKADQTHYAPRGEKCGLHRDHQDPNQQNASNKCSKEPHTTPNA